MRQGSLSGFTILRALAVGMLALLSLSDAAHAADGLYGWVYTPGSPGSSRLVTFDLTSGARTTIGSPTADCCFIAGGSAIDGIGNRFFFTGFLLSENTSTDPFRLFTVDTITGMASSVQLGPGSPAFLEWDPGSNQLFAVVVEAGTGTLYTVDPATGSRTAVGAGIADCCSTMSNTSAIDPAGGRFFFVGSLITDSGDDLRIFTVDLTTGALVTDPAPAMPSGINYTLLGWDPSSGTLYTEAYDTAEKSEGLLTVDPANGTVAQVGAGIPDCCGTMSGVGAVDPINDLFIFLGERTTLGEPAFRLFSVNLGDGTFANEPLLSEGENYGRVEFAAAPVPVGLVGFTVE